MLIKSLLALALTVGIEAPIATLLGPRDRRRSVARDAALLNLFTNPLAQLAHALWAAPGVPWGLPFIVIEVCVVVTEAAGYWWVTRLTWRRAAAVSIVCNGATIGLSLML